MQQFGVDVRLDVPVEWLSIAQRQLVQIARALLTPHRVVIFDEPTASLTPVETQALHRRIRELKEAGVAVLYISHRLEEVKAIADFVYVLRDGKLVASKAASELQPVDMARLMVGRDLQALYPDRPPAPISRSALEVRHFNVPGHAEDASFKLHKSEVLGFFGLIGAGRTELFEALLGLRKGNGEIEVDGKRVHIANARDGMDAGIAYLTEDRKSKGLLLAESMATNLTLASLRRFTRGFFVDRKRETGALDKAITDYDIRTGNRQAHAGELSGGNQQKLLLAKMLLFDPSIVIIDEPTRGVDIGAKQQIYRFIAAQAQAGKSIIIISSEMSELIGLCHRIIVMRNGRIVGEVAGDAIREEDIVVLATGVANDTKERLQA
jgi:ribose transport system ATP-binding protein